MNILDLKEFYHTPLGMLVYQEIKALLQTQWSDFGQHFSKVDIACGYPLPYLEVAHLHPVILFDHLGGIAWPFEENILNKVVLANEEKLPFESQSIHRLLMIHALEYAQNSDFFLKEAHRVLENDGSLLIIVPNRRSFWAHSAATPLGYGCPYTMTQLKHKLESCGFEANILMRGLYSPPSAHNLLYSFSNCFEKTGPLLMRKFSGIVGIEAKKSADFSFSIPKLVAPRLTQMCYTGS